MGRMRLWPNGLSKGAMRMPKQCSDELKSRPHEKGTEGGGMVTYRPISLMISAHGAATIRKRA